MVSILEYSLHFATVLSRWAREYTNEVGALEVLQKIYSLSPKPLSFFRREPAPQGKGRAEKMHIPASEGTIGRLMRGRSPHIE